MVLFILFNLRLFLFIWLGVQFCAIVLVSFGQKSVSLFKIGKGFKLTDEVRNYVSLDVLGIYLRDFGVQLWKRRIPKSGADGMRFILRMPAVQSASTVTGLFSLVTVIPGIGFLLSLIPVSYTHLAGTSVSVYAIPKIM